MSETQEVFNPKPSNGTPLSEQGMTVVTDSYIDRLTAAALREMNAAVYDRHDAEGSVIVMTPATATEFGALRELGEDMSEQDITQLRALQSCVQAKLNEAC